MLCFSRLFTFFWVAASMLCCPMLKACNDILLISNNSHFAIVHRIEAVIYTHGAPKPKVKHLILEDTPLAKIKQMAQEACLVVCIGAESTQTMIDQHVHKPLFSVLIRKNNFQQITRNHKGDKITALYLDQPLERQIHLIQSLFTKNPPKRLGVLLGPQSIEEEDALNQLAKHYQFDLHSIYVNKLENPVAVLDGLLNEAQVVLALPDNQIYNPRTSRGVLLSAFHKRVPLIGYSRTYVNNGAIAAVYSTTKQVADQAAEQIIAAYHDGRITLPACQYPKEFTVSINYQVALSMGLNLESERKITETLRAMEGTRHGA